MHTSTQRRCTAGAGICAQRAQCLNQASTRTRDAEASADAGASFGPHPSPHLWTDQRHMPNTVGVCAVLYVCSQGRAFAGPAQGRVRASLPRVGGFRH
jgi:hypothetical protein